MTETERNELITFINNTRDAVVGIVGSRFDAVAARLLPDTPATLDAIKSRPPRIHALKCWPRYFQASWHGTKTAEVRVNDREFAVGDVVSLREWIPEQSKYTTRWIVAVITSMTDLRAVVPYADGAGAPVLLSLAYWQRGNADEGELHPSSPREGFCLPATRTALDAAKALNMGRARVDRWQERLDMVTEIQRHMVGLTAEAEEARRRREEID